MAAISSESIKASERISKKANDLAELVSSVARVLNWILTIFAALALIGVYQAQDSEYGVNWGEIWVLWASVFGIWLFYSFLLTMIKLFAAQVRTQAWLLAIQTQQAKS